MLLTRPLKSARAGVDKEVMTASRPTIDDVTLDRARAGERDALGSIWEIYHPQVLRFLRSKRAASPEDVASQVWIDVGRAIGRFAGDGRDLQRWIFTIAARRSVDEHRRAARRRDLAEVTALDERRVDTVEDVAEGRGAVDEAIALLRRLPPTMASAVMLREVLDLTVADTAEVLGCTEANVRTMTHRGLTRLRAMLAEGSGGSTGGAGAPVSIAASSPTSIG